MDLLLLFVMVVGLMLIGVPIAVSLGLSSILFLLWFSDSSMASVAQTLFEAFDICCWTLQLVTRGFLLHFALTF